MKNFKYRAIILACGLSTLGAWGQQPTFLLPGLRPDLKIQNMRPVSPLFTSDPVKGMPNVGSWTWLPDGRLFVATMDDSIDNEAWEGTDGNVLGNSHGIMFSGLPTANDSSGVTAALVTNGVFNEPLGSNYLNGHIYVTDNKHGIRELIDSANGFYSLKPIYSGLLGSLTGKGGSNNYGDRRWDAGLLYKAGFFYAVVGMGFPQGGVTDTTLADIYRGRGTVLQIDTTGTVVDTVAGGVRVPVSLEFGPDSEMFYLDQQGSWEPEAALFDVRQGRFFGHPFTPFDNLPLSPPAVVFPYGNGGLSGTTTLPLVSPVPTDFVTLKSGPYVNQMLFGDDHVGGMTRVFLEKVNGEYQGAVFPFSQGMGMGSGNATVVKAANSNFSASVNRVCYGPDGNIYLGGGSGKGANTGGAWGWYGSNQWGLARLIWRTDTTVFEMKAIRSKSSTTMEVEFTEPVTPSSVVTANFTVHQTMDVSGGTGGGHGVNVYGTGQNAASAALTVTGATLDSTGTKVTLTITGLMQRNTTLYNGREWGYVQQIWAKGVTAVSGHTIWGGGNQGGGVGWYTTNTFGPGTDVGSGSTSILTNRDGSLALQVQWLGDGLRIQTPVNGAYTLRVLDASGKTSASFNVSGNEFVIPATAFGHGLRWVEARNSSGKQWITRVAMP